MDDANVIDSIGGANGAPVNNNGNIVFANGAAVFPGLGNAASCSYISLPGGLITGYNNLTLELWATIQPNGNWNEICAFGEQDGAGGGLDYCIVVPHSGLGDYRMSLKTGGSERATSGAAALDTGTPVHITAVYDANQNEERLYANGVLVSTAATTIDLNNVNDVVSWLGRGVFDGDASFKGSIDEFRIWSDALTPLQISVNDGLGANVVNSNPGAFVNLSSVSVPNTTVAVGANEQATALATFANVANVPLNSQVTNWVSSNPSVLTVNAHGLVQSVGPLGTATISATAFGSTASVLISVSSQVQPTITQNLVPVTKFVGSPAALTFGANGGSLHYYWYRNATLLTSQTNTTLNFAGLALSDDANYSVTASNAIGTVSSSTVHLTVLQQALTHRYSMDDANVTDSIGGANGTPTTGNVIFSGGQALFPGDGGNVNIPNGDYINLPAGLITGYNSVSMEFWATITNSGDGWRWLAGFGNQNTRLIVVPESGNGINDSRMTIQTGGNERVAGGAPRLDTGVPVHIVAVWNADRNVQQLYANGMLVATDSTTIDLGNISDDLNVLGRGFYGDPNPPCAIDEFRIWNGPLTPEQIIVNDGLGANVVNTNAGAFQNLSSVSVPSPTMLGGTSQQATALASYANVSNVPFNRQVTNWVSSNPGVATVNGSGLVTAIGTGSTTISATARGSTASVVISVSSAQPTISQDLAPVTKFVGSPAVLTVGALGGNLHYYWYRNATLLTSQTNPTLNIAGLALSDDADYHVTASNAVGTVTSSTAHLTVLQQALTHRYSMDDANVTDSIGGANGTPATGNVTFSGGQAHLSGDGGGVNIPNGDYINLPTGLITGYNSVTFEMWCTVTNTGDGWRWLAGFGNQNTRLIFMAESGFNDARMTIQTGGNERVAAGPRQDNSLPVLITAVFNADQNLQQFYINGVLAGTDSTTIDLNNISDDLNVLGRGFYGDPNPNCAIDEFRIWNGPLTPQQIAANYGLGPDVVSTNAGGAFLGLASVSVPNTTMVGNGSQQATALALFANTNNVPFNSDVTNWVSSNPSVLTVSSSGLVQSVGPIGSATISATAFGSTATSALISVSSAQPTMSQDLVPETKFVGSPAALTFGALGGNLHYYWYRNSTLLTSQTNTTLNFAGVALGDDANYHVTASNSVGTVTSSTVHLTVLQQALTHRYSMDDATVTDSIGGANGTPVNNVTFSGGQAFLPGTQLSGPTGDYIDLGPNLITGYSSLTFECWATIVNNGNNFHWLVGFGDYTSLTDWLIVSPDSSIDARMTIKTLGSERGAVGAPKLDTGVPVYIAAVYDADQNQMRLYANGMLVASSFTTIDLVNVNDSVSWIGRSFFSGDASIQGSIDEFRIWNGPLTPQQIAANDGFGPNTMTANAGGAFLGLSSVSVPNASMLISASQQATALASFANAANVPFNNQVTNWVSSNPGVATVSGAGLVTAVAAGSATISATAFGSTASVGITVSPVALQFTHSGSVLNLNWPLGELQQTTNLLSGWNPVIGAISPYSVTNSGKTNMFFRVQVQ